MGTPPADTSGFFGVTASDNVRILPVAVEPVLSIGRQREFVGDHLDHAVGIGQYVDVPEADYPVAEGFNDHGSSRIGRTVRMLPAIHFNSQLRRATRKVNDVVADRKLAGEPNSQLRTLEARQKTILTELASLRPVPRLAPAVIEGRLAEWRRLLRASTTQGRTVLQRILRGRLTFTPRVNPVSGEVDGYDFSGPTRFDRLFTGIAVERPKGMPSDRTGCEGIGPEDTFEGDYGRLLDRAYAKSVKVLASPTGFEPVF